jgi:hypothetical protein
MQGCRLEIGDTSSGRCRTAVTSQACEQPGIPPLRAVVADGDCQGFSLSDQHEQPLAPSDPGVDAQSDPRYPRNKIAAWGIHFLPPLHSLQNL